MMNYETLAPMRSLEKTYRDVLDKHAIVAMTDTKGFITFVNPRFCQVSGYSESELLGRSHKIVNSGFHSREFWRNMWNHISQGEVFRADIRNQAKDGSFYWVDTTIYPVYGDGNSIEGYFSVRKLITDEVRKAEAESAEMRRQTALSEKLAMAKHDINNLLCIAYFYEEEFLEKRRSEDAEKAFRILHRIESILSSLTVKRKGCLNHVRDGYGFLNDLIGENKSILDKHHISLELSVNLKVFEWEIPVEVLGRCLQNLIMNSVEELVHVEGDRKIYLSIESERLNPQIFYSDSGRGIEPAKAPSIFERGFSTKVKEQESGIGLYSCKQSLNEVGFDICLVNFVKTTFLIYKQRR